MAIDNLKKSGFSGGNVHPCLYVKKSTKCIIYVVLYVDDNVMVKNSKAIDEEIEQLQEMVWIEK